MTLSRLREKAGTWVRCEQVMPSVVDDEGGELLEQHAERSGGWKEWKAGKVSLGVAEGETLRQEEGRDQRGYRERAGLRPKPTGPKPEGIPLV